MDPGDMNFGKDGWTFYFAAAAVCMFLGSVVAFCSFVEKTGAAWLFMLSLVLGGIAIAISFSRDKGQQ
jgi:hypothetical protein